MRGKQAQPSANPMQEMQVSVLFDTKAAGSTTEEKQAEAGPEGGPEEVIDIAHAIRRSARRECRRKCRVLFCISQGMDPVRIEPSEYVFVLPTTLYQRVFLR